MLDILVTNPSLAHLTMFATIILYCFTLIAINRPCNPFYHEDFANNTGVRITIVLFSLLSALQSLARVTYDSNNNFATHVTNIVMCAYFAINMVLNNRTVTFENNSRFSKFVGLMMLTFQIMMIYTLVTQAVDKDFIKNDNTRGKFILKQKQFINNRKKQQNISINRQADMNALQRQQAGMNALERQQAEMNVTR